MSVRSPSPTRRASAQSDSVRITAADGHETALEIFGSSSDSALLFLPALGVPISYYQPFLSQLASAGFHVHGLELRGMTQSSITNVRRTDFGYQHMLTLDIPAALAALPAEPVALIGHSLGGQLALLYAAMNPAFAVPAVAIASGSSFHGTVASRRGRRIRRRQIAAVPHLVRILGYFPGHRLGFGGRQPKSVMLDWALEGQTGRYAESLESGLGAVRSPVLSITLEGDRLITEAAAAHLRERLTSAPVSTTRLPVSENAGEPFDHFRWARSNPTPVVRTITAFLGA